MPQSGKLRAFVAPRWAEGCAAAAVVNERASSSLDPSHHGDLTITRKMAEISRDLDRPPKPFRLSIEVLPFAEHGLWRVAPTRVLISTGMRADISRFGAAIAPILRDLV